MLQFDTLKIAKRSECSVTYVIAKVNVQNPAEPVTYWEVRPGWSGRFQSDVGRAKSYKTPGIAKSVIKTGAYIQHDIRNAKQSGYEICVMKVTSVCTTEVV